MLTLNDFLLAPHMQLTETVALRGDCIQAGDQLDQCIHYEH